MVIDTSAIVAIAFGEAEEIPFLKKIAAAPVRLISAASILEAAIVVSRRRNAQMARELEQFVAEARIEIVPFDERQFVVAREAFLRFGKGAHPAGLNFGDCFAYALAATRGEPLLYKGTDFAMTDVEPA